jgi:hypothetical protein
MLPLFYELILFLFRYIPPSLVPSLFPSLSRFGSTTAQEGISFFSLYTHSRRDSMTSSKAQRREELTTTTKKKKKTLHFDYGSLFQS